LAHLHLRFVVELKELLIGELELPEEGVVLLALFQTYIADHRKLLS